MVRSPARRAPGLLAPGAAAERRLLGGDPIRRPDRDPHGLADVLVGARRRLPGGARRRAARDQEVDARDGPSPAHRAPRDLLEALLGPRGRQVRGLDPRRRARRLGPRAPEGRVRLRARDQPRPADPVPVLDLHRAAGGRPAADLVGRPDDREPGPGPLPRGRRPRRHGGLPTAPLPVPRGLRGVRLRRPPARPSPGRPAGRRDPSAHDRAVGRRPERAGVPQLLRRADDRRQRDHAAHDEPRDARVDGASRAAEAPPGGARADPARHRGDPAVGHTRPSLPPHGDARTSSSGA